MTRETQVFLEEDPFLLGFGLFSRAILLVLQRVVILPKHFGPVSLPSAEWNEWETFSTTFREMHANPVFD